MDITSIGEFLRKARKEKGITQGYVADHLGVTAQAVSKWERGENLPDLAFLPDISKLLGVGVDEILSAGKPQSANDNITSDLQKLVDSSLFDKILDKFNQVDAAQLLEIEMDFFVFLTTSQKTALIVG